jgi:ABC-type bacteriocin/lantibiotic exporter with double-glycine peptidase domain
MTKLRNLALSLVVAFGLVTGAWAERTEVAPGQYVVGIPSDQFVHFAAPEGSGRQRMQNWCWAACIQMVLNWHGLYINQEEIVRRVFGGTVDRPAQPNEMLSALRGSVPDARGGQSQIEADPVNVNAKSVIQDLEYRWPLVVGLSGKGGTGHAYVMTAAYFYNDKNSGNPVIFRVVLRDPYPTKQSRVEMSMDEFSQRCTFVTRVHVKRL